MPTLTSRLRAVFPARREARRMLFGTLLTAFGVGMTLPFLFIYLTKVRHIDPTIVGAVVAWTGVLGIVLAGPSGTLIDRFGARRVVLPLYVIEALGVGSYAFVHVAWQAFVSATLAATGSAVLWGAQNTLLSTVTGEEERQHVFGLSFALLNLGIGVGGVAAGFIADVHHPDSFRTLYLVNGIAALVPALVLLTMPHVGHRIVAPTVEDASAGSGGYREVFADRALRRFTCYALLIMVCGYAQFEVGLPAFASLVSGVSTRTIAWGLAANTVTIVLAQLFVLRWMAGRSRSRGLAFVGVVIGVSWLILGLTAVGRHPVLAAVGVALCACVFACGETVMSPTMPSVINALAPDALRGRYNAVSGMVGGVTSVVGPLTAAPLIGHGLGAVWIGLIVAGALAASVVAVSLRPLLTAAQDGRAEVGAVDVSSAGGGSSDCSRPAPAAR